MANADDLKRAGDERLREGDVEGALDAFGRAAETARAAGLPGLEAAARQGVGRARLAAGDAEAALAELRAALGAHLDAGDGASAGAALGYMGQAAMLEETPARAAMLLEWALALHRAGEHRLAEAFDLEAQGRALWGLEATAAALAAWWQARRLYADLGNPAAERVGDLLAQYADEIGPELAESMLRDLEANAEERRRSGVALAHERAHDDPVLRKVSEGLRRAFGGDQSD